LEEINDFVKNVTIVPNLLYPSSTPMVVGTRKTKKCNSPAVFNENVRSVSSLVYYDIS